MLPSNSGLPSFDGALCRAARALLGISQMNLCKAAGCGRKLLNDFENGLVTPKIMKIVAIRTTLEEKGAIFLTVEGIQFVGARNGYQALRSSRGMAFSREAAD